MGKKTKLKKTLKEVPLKVRRINISIIAVGDIHGEFKGFVEILSSAGLIDKSLNWKAKNKILIQMGDVIDRGRYGIKVYKALAKLQMQAAKFKSKVVRLIGNHEIEILKASYFLTNLPPDEISVFRKKLISDILGGKILAAFARQNFFFTHAGICSSLLLQLTRELSPKKPTAKNLADLINKIVFDAVFKGDFSHSVFNVSPRRGGTDEFGGVFWEDFKDLVLSEHKHSFRQVVGHTPVSKITVSDDGKIIAADVGICKTFYSGRAYLNITGKKIKVVDLAGKPVTRK